MAMLEVCWPAMAWALEHAAGAQEADSGVVDEVAQYLYGAGCTLFVD